MATIETHSGIMLDLSDPKPEMIHPDDIALGLSRQARYGGQFRADIRFYSVAEHSLLVAEQVRHMGGTKEEIKMALLHDASEAYIGDISLPTKKLLPDYIELEVKLQSAIFRRFRLPENLPDIVRRVDKEIVHFERVYVMPPTENDWGLGLPSLAMHPSLKIEALTPREAYTSYRFALDSSFSNSTLKGVPYAH